MLKTNLPINIVVDDRECKSAVIKSLLEIENVDEGFGDLPSVIIGSITG